MSADATPVPPQSSAIDPSYFGLQRPRFHASATPRSPASNISPSHIETPLLHTEFRATIQSSLNLPSVYGRRSSSSHNNAVRPRQRQFSSTDDSRTSSAESRGSSPWKIPFKVPASYKQEKDRETSESSSERTKSRKGSGSFLRRRRGRSSTRISPSSTELSRPIIKIPTRMIEPLLPPIARQLTQSVPYPRKITIETDFEDSKPKPQQTPSAEEVLSGQGSKKGLLARSKKLLKLLGLTSQNSQGNVGTPLEKVESKGKKNDLERTSSMLRPVALARRVSPEARSTASKESKSDTIFSEDSRDSRGSHRFFSHRVWPRRRVASKSSSIQSTKSGVGPSSSPRESSTYLGHDQERHLKLDISNPRCANFLPSEAQRIGTPPVPAKGEHQDWTFHKRGFFYDYNAVPEEGTGERDVSDPTDGLQEGTQDPFNPRQKRRERQPSETGWFSLQMRLMDKEVKAERRREETLEYDVPEHFPSSPLCPKNLKHKSGGKGTCIYHGRNRSSSAKSEEEDLILNGANGGVD